MSESRAKLAWAIPSEKEEEEIKQEQSQACFSYAEPAWPEEMSMNIAE